MGKAFPDLPSQCCAGAEAPPVSLELSRPPQSHNQARCPGDAAITLTFSPGPWVSLHRHMNQWLFRGPGVLGPAASAALGKFFSNTWCSHLYQLPVVAATMTADLHGFTMQKCIYFLTGRRPGVSGAGPHQPLGGSFLFLPLPPAPHGQLPSESVSTCSSFMRP